MKKVALTGILVIATVVVYRLSLQDKRSVVSLNKAAVSSTREVFMGARSSSKRSQSIVEDPCAAITSELEAIDFSTDAQDWIQLLEKSSIDECDLPEYLSAIDQIKSACFDNLNEEECSRQSVFLRAKLRTRHLKDSDDKDLLADLILNEFSQNPPDFKKLIKFSSKLLEKDPNQLALQKLWAGTSIIASLEDRASFEALNEKLSQRVDESLWQDPDMEGMKLALETGLEPGMVEKYARDMLNEKDESRTHEILGWSLWRQNRFTEAVSELEKAIVLNPQDAWLKDQLKKVKSKDRQPDTYQARISIGINLEDLYQ